MGIAKFLFLPFPPTVKKTHLSFLKRISSMNSPQAHALVYFFISNSSSSEKNPESTFSISPFSEKIFLFLLSHKVCRLASTSQNKPPFQCSDKYYAKSKKHMHNITYLLTQKYTPSQNKPYLSLLRHNM